MQMGKKSSWLSAVKKALTPSDHSKKKKDKRSSKKSSKKYWFGKQRCLNEDLAQTETVLVDPVIPVTVSPPTEELKLFKAENEQSKHAYSVAYATAVAAEAAVAAAHAAAEVVRLTSTSRFLNKSTEEMAAIKIQSAYRGHLARRTLRAVRGLGRLKLLIQGQSVNRQATSTLRCMQTLARVQCQVRSRRIRMSEENKVLQHQLLMKHEKDLNDMRSSLGSGWNDSRKSKEETDASIQSKQDAAIRRERALAYAHTHQQMWKNSAKSVNPTFLDPNNPHWGWSWLERWMAARPWEAQSISDKEPLVGDMAKRVSRPSSRQSPSSRVRPESQNGSVDEDIKSYYSVQSDRTRRLSTASSVASVDSSPSLPGYMASTKSTKARSRMASPSPSPLGSGRKGTSEISSAVGSAKKRLSFTGSPARPTKRFSEQVMTDSNS